MERRFIFICLAIAACKSATFANAGACSWTSPSGYRFDLSPLRRAKEHSHYTFETRDKKYKYFLNVCDHVHSAPYPCSNTEDGFIRGPAYQSYGSTCKSLGSLDSVQWSLIDDNVPGKGIELTYGEGEACNHGPKRMVKYHFICAPGFDTLEPPLLVYEKPSDGCHYNVTWPSKYACPSSWPRFEWMILCLAAIVGIVIAVHKSEHKETISAPFLVAIGFVLVNGQWIADKVHDLVVGTSSHRHKYRGYRSVKQADRENASTSAAPPVTAAITHSRKGDERTAMGSKHSDDFKYESSGEEEEEEGDEENLLRY